MKTRYAARVLIFLGLVALAWQPDLAWAETKKCNVTVDVIKASMSEGTADSRLDKLRSQLGDFAYRSYRLLAERTASINQGESQTIELAGGKQLKITFKQVDKDGRVRLKLSIPGVLDTTVSLALQGSVVLGGPAMPYEDGVLFVPIALTQVQ